MKAREKLNDLKALWGLKTDEELSKKLEISKETINSWIKRDKIPEKWELKIGQMNNIIVHVEQSVPANTLNNHIADREMEIIKAFRELSAEKQEVYYYKIKLEAAEERIKNQEQPSTAAKYA
jgi:DNA-binding XRE family transcriptional regulator